MSKLKLLIVCLLVVCKAISQNVILKDSVVILNQNQAKQIISDLIKYDALKQISELQEIRIQGFLKKENLFNKELSNNKSIIVFQSKLIDKQNKLISESKKLHGYITVINNKMLLSETAIRFSLLIERQKIKGGLFYTIQQNYSPTWGILLEYKLF